MLYRALYAHETCGRRSAVALLRRAIRFDDGVFGAGNFSSNQARTLLASLENQGRMDLSDDQALIAQSELDAVNARAARCTHR